MLGKGIGLPFLFPYPTFPCHFLFPVLAILEDESKTHKIFKVPSQRHTRSSRYYWARTTVGPLELAAAEAVDGLGGGLQGESDGNRARRARTGIREPSRCGVSSREARSGAESPTGGSGELAS